VLTVPQVADRLRVSAGLVYSWVESGLLACYRFGNKGKRGAIRVAEADLAAFMEERKTKKIEPVVKPAPRTRTVFKHLRIP
jgi:excisionase family DNA binding protein